MTHEATPDAEATGGPEHDDTLPDATSGPVADGPDELPPIDHADEPGDQLVSMDGTP